MFDTTGNIGPSIWADGRIVGGWGQAENGEVRYELLDDVGTETAAAIESEADRWTKWLAGVRVAPRGRRPSPLETELSKR
jgi:hypothetical protein